MYLKNLLKLDKFYYLFAAVMLAVSFFVVYVFKVIFDSINASADIGTQFTEVELKIDRDKLNKAVSVASEKEVVKLEIR